MYLLSPTLVSSTKKDHHLHIPCVMLQWLRIFASPSNLGILELLFQYTKISYESSHLALPLSSSVKSNSQGPVNPLVVPLRWIIMIIICGSSIFCLVNHAKTNLMKREIMLEKCIRSKSNLDI